jgi:hypothetical protein
MLCMLLSSMLLTGLADTPTINMATLRLAKLSLYFTELRHEDVWGSGSVTPRILHLATSWRLVVIFTPRPLFPWFPLYWGLNGPHSRSGRYEEKILGPTGTRTPTPRSLACSHSRYRPSHLASSLLAQYWG